MPLNRQHNYLIPNTYEGNVFLVFLLVLAFGIIGASIYVGVNYNDDPGIEVTGSTDREIIAREAAKLQRRIDELERHRNREQ